MSGFRPSSTGIAPLLALVLAGPAAAAPAEPPGQTVRLAPPVRLRVPSPAYVFPGASITGTVEALFRDPDGKARPARAEEIAGTIRVGDVTVPVRSGRFILRDLPAGRHTVQIFAGEGIGAELTRTTLIVPDRPPTGPHAGPYRGPTIIQAGSRVLITGPFRGEGDDPRLLIAGTPARMLWEAPLAAHYRVPADLDAGAGPVRVELLRSGEPAAGGLMNVVKVRFDLPSAPVAGRGEEIPFGAEVSGLPPSGGDGPPNEGLLELRFRNLSPDVVTDLWSKSPRARQEDGDLVVPILPGMVGPDGSARVAGRMLGKSRGPFRVVGTVGVADRLSAARNELTPAGP